MICQKNVILIADVSVGLAKFVSFLLIEMCINVAVSGNDFFFLDLCYAAIKYEEGYNSGL